MSNQNIRAHIAAAFAAIFSASLFIGASIVPAVANVVA